MPLPLGSGTGGNHHAPREVDAHSRSLERSDAGALDVASDADATVDALPAERLLFPAELRVAGGLQRRVERGREVSAVVHERVAVTVRHTEVVRHLLGPDV